MDYNNLTEEELLKRFQKGDVMAIDFVFEKYKKMVSSIARRYFLVGAEQEDLVQEGMIGLYKACITFKPNSKGAKLSTYAYVCVSHAIHNAIKTANKKGNIPLNTALSLTSGKPMRTSSGSMDYKSTEMILFLPSPEPTPEKKLIDKEDYLELLDRIKENLSPYEFEVLSEYLKGYKCEYIAKKLHKDYKSIDNAITRIKSKLQFLRDAN